jgi:hypothetical protein
MNRAIGIVGGMIMVSAASFTIGANMTSIKGMVNRTFNPEAFEQPAEETAPIVVTDPGDDVINIPTDNGMTFSVMRKNVSCKTVVASLFHSERGFYDGLHRECSAYGVLTDLAGKRTQYNDEGRHCFKKENQYDNWSKGSSSQSLACSAARQFGAS